MDDPEVDRWVVADKQTGYRYVDVECPTRHEAEALRADLLKGMLSESEWHKRLIIRTAREARRSSIAKRGGKGVKKTRRVPQQE